MAHDQLLEICLLKKTSRHNFSTARANVTFFVNWSNPVNLWGSTGFEQFHRQKNINCSNCKWLTKVLENINCSTQFIVKKMVYMYGSQVRCTCMAVRIGVHVWHFCQVRLGQDRLVRLGKVRCTCMAVRLGVHVWQLGQVRSGQVRSGQVGQFRS